MAKMLVLTGIFFISCEDFLMPGTEKEYFVFTNAKEYEFCQNKNVHTIFHQKQGWPYDTLLRFQTFLRLCSTGNETDDEEQMCIRLVIQSYHYYE